MSYPSKDIVLTCGQCGEKVILASPLEVWHSTRTTFECECGQNLTLTDRAVEGTVSGT